MNRRFQKPWCRLSAMLLAIMLVISMFPAAAFASGEPVQQEQQQVEEPAADTGTTDTTGGDTDTTGNTADGDTSTDTGETPAADIGSTNSGTTETIEYAGYTGKLTGGSESEKFSVTVKEGSSVVTALDMDKNSSGRSAEEDPMQLKKSGNAFSVNLPKGHTYTIIVVSEGKYFETDEIKNVVTTRSDSTSFTQNFERTYREYELAIDGDDKAACTVKSGAKLGDDTYKYGSKVEIAFSSDAKVYVSTEAEQNVALTLDDKNKATVTVEADTVVTVGEEYEEGGVMALDGETEPEESPELEDKSFSFNVELNGTAAKAKVNVSVVNAAIGEGTAATLDSDTKSVTVNGKLTADANGTYQPKTVTVSASIEENGDYYTLSPASAEVTVAVNDFGSVTYNSKETNGETTTNDVTFTVTPKTYTIKYNDPLTTATYDDTAFTIESDAVTPHAGSKYDGKEFVFAGWTTSGNVTSESALVSYGSVADWAAAAKAAGGTINLYAVYNIADDMLKVTGSGSMNNSYTPDDNTNLDSVDAKDSAEVWFGSDVTLTPSMTFGTGIKPTETSYSYTYDDETKQWCAQDAAAVSVEAPASGEQTKEVAYRGRVVLKEDDVSYTYQTKNATTFTVKQDMQAPTMTASNKKVTQTGDGDGSGVWKIEYIYVDLTDITSGVESSSGAEAVKDTLRSMDGWTSVEENTEVTPTSDSGDGIVFRVVDKAGNDVYSALDTSVPTIEVTKYEYTNINGTQTSDNATVGIYSSGDIKVYVKITDKMLVYSDDTSGYSGCTAKLKIGDTEKTLTARATESQPWSPFNDTWTGYITIPADAVESGSSAQITGLTIDAKDQMGNNADPVMVTDTLVIDKQKPTVKVKFTDKDGKELSGDDTLYANGTTANITVIGMYFDPQSDDFDAQVTVKNGDTGVKDITWTKSKNKWTGTYTIPENTTANIRVSAKSQAGISSDEEQKTVVNDTTAPTIAVIYEGIDYPAAFTQPNSTEALYNNGNNGVITANISITDEHLVADAEAFETKITVKAGGESKEVKLTKSGSEWKGSCTFNQDGSGKTNGDVDEPAGGTYTLTVDASDAAGNNADTYTSGNLNNDSTAPFVNAVTIEKVDQTTADKVLNFLTFGIFFNTEVKVTATVIDANETWQSGVASVVMNTGEGSEPVTLTAAGSDGTYSAAVPESTVETWSKTVSFTATDNVGNNRTQNLTDFEGADTENTSNYLLYETKAPTITITEGAEFKDTKNDITWMKTGESITISVEDEKQNELASGLNSFAVKLNDSEVKTGSYDGQTYDDSYTISYADLQDGANTIVVNAKDNAGNAADEATLTVYKDSSDPTATDLYTTFDGVLYTGDGNHWLLKDESMTVTLTDSGENDSGLQKLYVTVNGTPKTTTQTADSKPSGEDVYNTYTDGVSSSNIITSESFDITYAELNAGENTIRVYAMDNVGNEYAEQTYTICKDSTAPNVDSLTLAPENDWNIQNFGNFYNEDLTVDVGLSDSGNSSGIDYVTVEYVKDDDTVTIKSYPESGDEPYAKAAADIKNLDDVVFSYEDNTEGYLRVTIVDNVGNTVVYGNGGSLTPDYTEEDGKKERTSDDTGSNMSKNLVMFEKNKPTITAANLTGNGNTAYTCPNDGKRWFSTYDVTVSFDVLDNTTEGKVSGLNNVEIKLNGNVITDQALNGDARLDGTDVIGDQLDTDEVTPEKTYSFNLRDINSKQDGENVLTVSVRDNAGNMSETYTEKLYIDTTAPEITGFEFVGTQSNRKTDTGVVDWVTVEDYGYYFQSDTDVTVYVKDANASAGLSTIYFKAIDVEKGEVLSTSRAASVTTCNTDGIGTASATFTVKEKFKGQIYAYVVDNVKYTSLTGDADSYASWKHPDGPILETQAHHNEWSSHVNISVPGASATDSNGNPLYGDSVQVTFSVDDTYNGIKSVAYTVESAYDNVTKGAEENVTSWSNKTYDKNLVTSASKTITVTNNSNDIKIKLTMTDNAGNTSTTEKTISIDKDAPKITVRYSPADEGDDATHTGYFKVDRTVTITILERNFTASGVNISCTRDGSGYGLGSGFSGGQSVNQGGIEYKQYTLTHTFSTDGDYTFAIAATDKVGHSTSDSQVDYGGSAVAKKFTIDKTKPVISIDISGDRGKENYYKGTVTLTVHITEHNFDSSRYTVSFTLKDSQTGALVSTTTPPVSTGGSGDNWTYTYTCSEEFIYQLVSIQVIDMAGNETTEYGGSYSGEAFVVDNTEPEIKIYTDSTKKTELDKTASKDNVTPVIVITDTNLDPTAYTMSLIGNYNRKSGNLTQTGKYEYRVSTLGTNTLQIAFDNFDTEEDFDDIYRFVVTATDKAGRSNETGTGAATFSVNRYGATYMVGEDTEALVDKFYTNEEQNVKIIEINAAPLTLTGENAPTVSVTCNAKTWELTSSKDYKLSYKTPSAETENGQYGTDSSWYEATYDIDKSQFEAEGRYAVGVYSADQAANTLSNQISHRTLNLFESYSRDDDATMLGDRQAADVQFQMDKTAPQVSYEGDDTQKEQFFTGQHEITVTATDDVMLDYVEYYVDGEVEQTLQAEEFEDGTATVTLDSDNSYRDVKFIAYDKAGNSYDSNETRKQVTMNPLAWFMGNHIAQAIAVVLAAGIIYFIYRRRKRAAEEEA